jgi:periplasmic divalent cation tolerance protein
MIIVMTTTPDLSIAEDLARRIIFAHLAACVQILPPMKSYYFWKDEVQADAEHLLLIKTLEEKFDDLERFIQENHPYEVPEIVAVSAENVSESYLSWMKAYLITEE